MKWDSVIFQAIFSDFLVVSWTISVVSRRADLLGFANSVSEGVAVLSRYTVKNVFADFAVCD